MANILVVEDEKAVRENILELLQSEGYSTYEAVDGQEGLYVAKREKIDLILCDIMMPIIDGYQLLKVLRRYPETMLIPVIFLTAKGGRDDQRAGMDLGAEDFITKPFSRVEVLQSIKSRLHRKDELDASITKKNIEIIQDGTMQLPYEFNSSLSIIHSLSELILERVPETEEPFIRDAAAIILRTVTNLKDIASKYIFINELEKKKEFPNFSFANPGANEQIMEIINEKAKDYQIEKVVFMLQDYSSKLDEFHLSRFIESVIAEIFRDADPREPIEILGANTPDRNGYDISIDYRELLPHFDDDISNDVQHYHKD